MLGGWSSAPTGGWFPGSRPELSILTPNDYRIRVGGSLPAETAQLSGRHLETEPKPWETVRLLPLFGSWFDSEG